MMFKVGDKVRCIRARLPYLMNNQECVVEKIVPSPTGTYFLRLENIFAHHNENRFELAEVKVDDRGNLF